MARYTGPVCRLCRREGCKLFLKGDRCFSEKCGFTKRPVAPGQHGQSRKKASEYGIQLREKQKVKRAYGMSEKQFRSYFELAAKQRGVTGAYMLMLLERFKQIAEQAGKPVPKWLSVAEGGLSASVVALPERDDMDLTIEEHLIVELYSR